VTAGHARALSQSGGSGSYRMELMQATICSLFERSVHEHAERPALVCGGRQVTYREVDHATTGVTRLLRQSGLGKGELVGVVGHRSVETIAAILGILKAGGAFLPFDLSYPANLLRYIYDDSAPRIMIVQRSLGEGTCVPRFWAKEPLYLDPDFRLSGGPSDGQLHSKDNGAPEAAGVDLTIGPEDLAYVMYTSGSTGRPKGVMVPHRGVTRLVSDCEFVALGPGETVLHLAPLSFDASTFEIWGALLNGGRLAVVPAPHPSLDQIADAIRVHQVTTLWLTAGLFNLMVEWRLDGLKPLRQLIVGGDALSPPHIEKALSALPDCRIVNGYGPTENTTFTCCYAIPRDGTGRRSIPIGSAIRGTTVYVLDEAMRPVADGEEGELYAGGAGVAHGYLNQPQLTAEKFVPDPFGAAPGGRLYRTGDRVRRRRDGNLEFLGRVDRQVKINGKRVELDGIETCLRRAPTVSDAAVISRIAGDGRSSIAAFVTATDGCGPTPTELRAFLRSELPDFMIPAEIIVVDALPLSPTGKVDRVQLAHARPATATATLRSPPAGRTQEILQRIWCGILSVAAVGDGDNFFDLGGTSLQLLEAHAEIAAAFAVPLTVLDLFEHPNIRGLAAKIDGAEAVKRSLFAADDRVRRRNAALARARPAAQRKGAA
jgi:amino acid adenylation domain-containing protein